MKEEKVRVKRRKSKKKREGRTKKVICDKKAEKVPTEIIRRRKGT
jgi:hypothetical protein